MNRLKNIFHKYEEIVNYLFFGFLTVLISLFVYYLLTYTLLNPNNIILLQIANILSWFFGVIFAFFTNKKFVFKSKSKYYKKELVSFMMVRISTLLLDMIIMFIGVTIFYFNDKILKIFSQIVVIICNYIFSKIVVFKKNN